MFCHTQDIDDVTLVTNKADYKEGGINMTGFSMLDSRAVEEFMPLWQSVEPVSNPGAGKNTISVTYIQINENIVTKW